MNYLSKNDRKLRLSIPVLVTPTMYTFLSECRHAHLLFINLKICNKTVLYFYFVLLFMGHHYEYTSQAE